MPNALFLSPHHNTVALSCGGTLIRLLRSNWRVTLVTIFTATSHDLQIPSAAAAPTSQSEIVTHQTPLQLQQQEEDTFDRVVGVRDRRRWNFASAVNRGYANDLEIFGGIKADDEVWSPIADQLCELLDEFNPDAVFAPQALGNHVDHLQTILAVKAAGKMRSQSRWYRDLPYALREPEARPSCLLPQHLKTQSVALKEMDMERKILGCSAYSSHIDTEFGGTAELGRRLRAFHHQESQGLQPEQLERYAECFLAPKRLPPLF